MRGECEPANPTEPAVRSWIRLYRPLAHSSPRSTGRATPTPDLAARYARLGDAARARQPSHGGGTVPSTTLPTARCRGDSAAGLGEIALARRKAHRGPCTFPGGDLRTTPPALPALPQAMARAFDAAGNADSARAFWGDRYLASTSRSRIKTTDWREMPALLLRQGDIAAEKGDRARAADYYQKYVDLRREADPVLQPQVAEVKKKLVRSGRREEVTATSSPCPATACSAPAGPAFLGPRGNSGADSPARAP